MKTPLIICIIVLSGVLGYLLEPSLRPLYSDTPANGRPKANPDSKKVILQEAPIHADPKHLSNETPQAPATPPQTPIANPPAAEWNPSAETSSDSTPAPQAGASSVARERPTASAPTTASGTVSSSDVVAVMKNSILAAEIKEFNFDQVSEWKADATETVQGETFETGIATYQVENPFGKKTIQAKAYIQNGKVVRWIWPNTGIQLK